MFVGKKIWLSNYFSPKLKLHVPLEDKNGTVYSFTCPCESQTYIGESKRQLYKRIYEHNRIKDSPIYMHIQECETYKSKMSHEFGVSPTPSDRRNFIKNWFKPLCTSASNYYKRTRLEAIAIRLNSPPLNEQIHHKKVSIIWRRKWDLTEGIGAHFLLHNTLLYNYIHITNSYIF